MLPGSCRAVSQSNSVNSLCPRNHCFWRGSVSGVWRVRGWSNPRVRRERSLTVFLASFGTQSLEDNAWDRSVRRVFQSSWPWVLSRYTLILTHTHTIALGLLDIWTGIVANCCSLVLSTESRPCAMGPNVKLFLFRCVYFMHVTRFTFVCYSLMGCKHQPVSISLSLSLPLPLSEYF